MERWILALIKIIILISRIYQMKKDKHLKICVIIYKSLKSLKLLKNKFQINKIKKIIIKINRK